MKEGRRLSERRKLNEATFAFELLKRKIGYPLRSHLSGDRYCIRNMAFGCLVHMVRFFVGALNEK